MQGAFCPLSILLFKLFNGVIKSFAYKYIRFSVVTRVFFTNETYNFVKI